MISEEEALAISTVFCDQKDGYNPKFVISFFGSSKTKAVKFLLANPIFEIAAPNYTCLNDYTINAIRYVLLKLSNFTSTNISFEQFNEIMESLNPEEFT